MTSMRKTACPACGEPLGTSGHPTTSDEVLTAIESLTLEARAMIRTKLLARYDASGRAVKGHA